MNNPLEELIGYQLHRASTALMCNLVRNLEPFGLKPTEASVLLLIQANPGVTQSELGRELGIQRANMTPLAAGLGRRGLVKRTRVDGRSHGLEITPEGAQLAARARATIDLHDAALIERVPAAIRTPLIEGVARIWRRHDEE